MSKLNRMPFMIPAAIAELFSDYPWLGIKMKLEGVAHDDDASSITFGGRAGPSVECSNLVHEMAHFLEIDDDRIAADNWGFRFGIPCFFMDHFEDFALSASATNREIRTWAIQSALSAALGLEAESPDELAKSSVWMSDFINVPGRTEEEKVAWVAGEIAGLAGELDADDLLAEWHRKAALVPLLMERRRRKNELLRISPPECIEEVADSGGTDNKLILAAYRGEGLEIFSVIGMNGDIHVFERDYPNEEVARRWFDRILAANEFERTEASPLRGA